ncbi:MAG: WXG100 family type VII secretion target [Clostridia bacterium]|nr:WXG100 family type VII secretion target [Clostridia bacterium]
MPIYEKGRSKAVVVRKVIKDLYEFDEAVTAELNMIKRKTDDLEEAWKDAQYHQFKGFIEEITTALKKDLAILEEARADLERRLTHYD